MPQELHRPHPGVSHNISNEIDDRALLVRHILESFGCVVNDSVRAECAEKVGVARGPGCGHDSSQPSSELDRKVSNTTGPGVDEHTLPGLHASGFYRPPCGECGERHSGCVNKVEGARHPAHAQRRDSHKTRVAAGDTWRTG